MGHRAQERVHVGDGERGGQPLGVERRRAFDVTPIHEKQPTDA